MLQRQHKGGGSWLVVLNKTESSFREQHFFFYLPTMKSILLFFLFIAVKSFSQDCTTEELTIPFEWHPESASYQLTGMNYSTTNFLDARRDYSPELPYSQTGVELLNTSFYRFENRFLEFTQYPGIRFFFQEWSDSLRSDLLHFGEVEVDVESMEMREVTLTSMEGEDSLGFDFFYTFKKVGAWEFRLPDNTKLYGNYENGKRSGIWTNYLNSFIASSDFLPTLTTYDYKEGTLKSKTLVDKSHASNAEKLKFLNAKWGWKTFDAKGAALYKQGYKVLRFYKEEEAKFPCSGKFMDISTKSTLLKWQVNEDNTVVIEGVKFTILYLTEEHLLLQVVE